MWWEKIQMYLIMPSERFSRFRQFSWISLSLEITNIKCSLSNGISMFLDAASRRHTISSNQTDGRQLCMYLLKTNFYSELSWEHRSFSSLVFTKNPQKFQIVLKTSKELEVISERRIFRRIPYYSERLTIEIDSESTENIKELQV